MRAVTYLYEIQAYVINFGYLYCSFVGGLCSFGYRIGQTIALIMAFDRFLAIWRPGFYAMRQGKVRVMSFEK